MTSEQQTVDDEIVGQLDALVVDGDELVEVEHVLVGVEYVPATAANAARARRAPERRLLHTVHAIDWLRSKPFNNTTCNNKP